MTSLWHDKARQLRADGLPYDDIAGILGLDSSTIRRAISDGVKAAPRPKGYLRNPKDYYGIPHNPSSKPTVKRIQSQPVPKEIFDAAILAFARQEISREQLMFRITPQDKWRGKSWEEM